MSYFFKHFPAKNIPPAAQSQLETTSFFFIKRRWSTEPSALLLLYSTKTELHFFFFYAAESNSVTQFFVLLFMFIIDFGSLSFWVLILEVWLIFKKRVGTLVLKAKAFINQHLDAQYWGTRCHWSLLKTDTLRVPFPLKAIHYLQFVGFLLVIPVLTVLVTQSPTWIYDRLSPFPQPQTRAQACRNKLVTQINDIFL